MMRFYKYAADGVHRLRFECETEGSQSFKANRGSFVITVTLEREAGHGASYSEVRTIARRVIPPRGYTYSRVNHYGELCLRAWERAEPLPGGLDEQGNPLPEVETETKRSRRRV